MIGKWQTATEANKFSFFLIPSVVFQFEIDSVSHPHGFLSDQLPHNIRCKSTASRETRLEKYFYRFFISRHHKSRDRERKTQSFSVWKAPRSARERKIRKQNFLPHFSSFAFYVFVRVVRSQLCVFGEENFPRGIFFRFKFFFLAFFYTFFVLWPKISRMVNKTENNQKSREFDLMKEKCSNEFSTAFLTKIFPAI